MENIALIGTQKLHFGNYAIRRFCRLQKCTSDPSSILVEFADENRADALFSVVQAGLEAAYALDKKPFDLDEFAISQFVDQLQASPDKGDSVADAFIGSVINKPAAEVPAWAEEMYAKAIKQAEAEAAAAAEAAGKETPAGTESPNVVAAPSPAGKTSKAAPTATV